MPIRKRSPGGAQEAAHDLDRRLWVLLHDPMSGAWDDSLMDVTGGETHDGGHRRAERLLAAHGQYWHREFPLREEGPIIDGVLIERRELREASVHGARQRVELRIVIACGFTEPARVRGELVPEAIEIDALAPRDQPLHVRTAKAEMPQQWIPQDLLPGADPG